MPVFQQQQPLGGHGGDGDGRQGGQPVAGWQGGDERVLRHRQRLGAALPPGHRLAALPSIPVAAMAAERMLLLEDGHCLRDQALDACGFARGTAPSDPTDGFAATSLHTLVQMVAGGLGVTLLPRLAVSAGIAEGTGIILRPLAGEGAGRVLGLAWRPNAARAAEYRSLAPALAQAVSEPD
jgi:LysR family hydrogen peroxide-inducible transcriptional activator